jgi:hypothetical protein
MRLKNTHIVISGVIFYWWLTFFLSSCGAPLTPVRRSAVILAPHTPVTAGRALKGGEIKITAGMNPVAIDFENNNGAPFLDAEPDIGDAGVFMPTTQISAQLLGGISDFFELGGVFLYGDYDWTKPSSIGVLPIPSDRDADVYAFGPAMRTNFTPTNRYVDIGLSFELLFASIPQATYICETCNSTWGSNSGSEYYSFYSFERKTINHWDISFHLAGKLKIFSPYLSLGFQNTVTNIGFDPRSGSQDESTLDNDETIAILNIGGELDLNPFYWDISLYFPTGHEQFDFSMGITTNIGIKFGGAKKIAQELEEINIEEEAGLSILKQQKPKKKIDEFPILD